jgi:pimeloyl-ACP methyl ester carboxylesterase
LYRRRQGFDGLGKDWMIVCIGGVGGFAREWHAVTPALRTFGEIVPAMPPQGSVILVGHSQGGIEALRLAAAQPDRVDAIVLTNSFFPPARAGRSAAAAALDYARHRVLYLRELTARDRPPTPTRRGVGQIASVARLGLRPSRFHDLAAAVSSPVLVIHGNLDHVVPVTFARAAVAAHPTWTLRESPGGGHHVHRDQPQWWGQVAMSFLTRLGLS